MKRLDNIQDILSIGYIILILLGILNETIYYNQLGINILYYSDILDVLIRPIAILSSNLTYLFTTFFLILLLIFVPPFIVHKKKEWIAESQRNKSDEELMANLSKIVVLGILLFEIGFFIGFGYYRGKELKEKINTKTLKYEDRLKWISEPKEENIKIVGQNSSYLFYLMPNDKKLKISPIESNIEYIVNSEKIN